MNINTDISAASNGAYQIRTRQIAIPSFDNPNPRAVQAQQSQANRAAAAALKPGQGTDIVQLSPGAAIAIAKQAETAATTPAKPGETPASNILEALINPEKPAKSESNAAPPSFTAADLEAMLELFGQSYDLNDADNADPLLVQYDLNGDGIIDSSDLSAMLNLIQ